MIYWNSVPPPAIAVAILDDLLFTAKIRETARVSGVELTVVRDASVLHQGPAPVLILLDLNSKRVDPFAALDVLRARADAGKDAPVVAFAAAVDKALTARAKSVGLDEILERAQLVERLPEILHAVARVSPTG